jgi:hypothetical protein
MTHRECIPPGRKLWQPPDDTRQHVWATRIKVSKPRWDRETANWVWDRYATKVTRTPATLEPEIVLRDNERNQLKEQGKDVDEAQLRHLETTWYKIPWPKGQAQELEESE